MTAIHSRLFRSFEEIPCQYLNLAGDSVPSTFDQTPVWWKTFAEHILSDSDRLCVIGLEDHNGEPVALLPMYVRATGRGQTGSHTIHSLANYYSANFAPLIHRKANVDQVGFALAQAIYDLPFKWHTLDLNPVSNDSLIMDSLDYYLGVLGSYTQIYERFGNWYLAVEGRHFSEYFETMPTAQRDTIRRKERKLLNTDGSKISVITDFHEVQASFDMFEEIYDKSWKSGEPYKDFIRKIALEYAKEDRLRFGLISVGDNPAAAQLWFLHQNTASIFKLAHDERYSQMSVGSILTKELMRYAIDIDQVEEVDFLSGDEPFKKAWMNRHRVRVGLRAYRKATVKGFMGMSQTFVGSSLKKFVSKRHSAG